MDRRSFIRGAAIGAGALPFHALLARAQSLPKGSRPPRGTDYGPLLPTPDATTGLPLLMLPDGFRYLSFGWTGDIMASGQPTPGLHDGMAAFKVGGGRIRVIRNHEVGRATPFSGVAYDSLAGGGTTTFEFDAMNGQFLGAWDSLSGTVRNCAGGPTPWKTWLTCEETNDFYTGGVPHGYIFEVPMEGHGSPVPLRDMGRFTHEAVAVDPVTGYVYETEDSGTNSGFYRFVPNVPGQLAEGGQLYMLKVAGVTGANLGAGYPNGSTFDVEWVPILNPENPASNAPGDYVANQGTAQGAAVFGRLEGAWYGKDGKIYFVSTSGGAVGQGQVWAYDPAEETVTLIFESPSSSVLNAPDNICVSPRGGLVLCEDGSGTEYLHGLTVDGTIFKFCQNNVILNGEVNGIRGNFTGSEFAGACFSPEGLWLFVNIQSPGITFAITGPWKLGAL